VAHVDEKSSEMQRLLKREGPKYQYGNGCLSDGVIGAWMAAMYGIEVPLAQAKIRSDLQAIFKHNFKTDLSEHANAQRPGYAMGYEPGLLLCSWPRGNKPTLPFVYSDEVPGRLASDSRRIGGGRINDREGGAQSLRWAHSQSLERVRVRQLVCARDVKLRAAGRFIRVPVLRGGTDIAVCAAIEGAAVRVLLFDGVRVRHDCAA
jgi:hypothetical protein